MKTDKTQIVDHYGLLTPVYRYGMQKWDIRYLRLAREVSTWSKDPSTQVGAIMVRPDRTQAGLGYNGFPSSMEDKKEWLNAREEKYERVVHAEINALLNSRDGSFQGYTIYSFPIFSCTRCATQLIQAGITRFVSVNPHPDFAERWNPSIEKSKQMMSDCGIAWSIYDRSVLDG